MIIKPNTYKNINTHFGKLSKKQVEGFESFFNKWDELELTDVRWLSYILATVWHETGTTMQPIEEIGKGKNKKYGKRVWYNGKSYTDIKSIFYGRGHTQNTWRDIYEKLTISNENKWDFVKKPELLLKMEPSIWATFHAMTTGLYTGKKLSSFFNEKTDDSIGARRIINGKDKAELISDYHVRFLNSIEIK